MNDLVWHCCWPIQLRDYGAITRMGEESRVISKKCSVLVKPSVVSYNQYIGQNASSNERERANLWCRTLHHHQAQLNTVSPPNHPFRAHNSARLRLRIRPSSQLHLHSHPKVVGQTPPPTEVKHVDAAVPLWNIYEFA